MNESDRLDRFRGYYHTGETPIATPHCLDAGTIAALADGTLPADARPQALLHLAACAFCRRAVASVSEALADGPVTHEIDVVEGRARRWWQSRTFRFAAPLAAAATILLLLRSPANDMGAVHRGGANQSSVPVPIGPIGTVASAPGLVWKGMLGAERFRVTLFDTGGDVLFEAQLSDTTVTLPDSVRLVAGQVYLWKVEARTGWDRWSGSELVEFTIARSPPP